MDAQNIDAAPETFSAKPALAKQIVRSIARHCRLIAGCTILGAAIACAVAWQLPPTYTAHARMKLDRASPDRDMPGDLLFVKLQLEVLQSQPMLRATVNALGANVFAEAGQSLIPELATARLKETIWVRRNPDNNLVELGA